MFNELMNKVVGPISDSLVIVKEAFAKCDTEEEVVLLKKVFQDMLNDEAELRKDAELNAAYEDSKEYFDLVEIVMDKCCKDCTKHCENCDLCKHFNDNEVIPFYDGNGVEKDLGNCKFSYKSEDVKKRGEEHHGKKS